MAHRISLVLAAALGASAVAPSAHADEDRAVIPAPESPRPDPLLATTGIVMLGLPYAFSAYGAAASNWTSDRWLYAPVVGPFADVIARNACTTEGCKGDVNNAAFALVLDGLMQGAGLYILIRTFTSPGTPITPPPAQARVRVHVAPTSYVGGGGLTAFGAF